jgi:hypothetical protein
MFFKIGETGTGLCRNHNDDKSAIFTMSKKIATLWVAQKDESNHQQ